jgi:hypothetical protein
MSERRGRTASHQTIRLSSGRHRRPEDGVCVMELASMLAGERFSDHPRSVCPVIGAFLRSYNDQVDDERRQDLYEYAAEAVGTRSDRVIRRARIDLCRRFVERFETSAPPGATRLLWLGKGAQIGTRAGSTAAALVRQPEGHLMALALLDALIACTARADRRATGEEGHVRLPSSRAGSRRADVQP